MARERLDLRLPSTYVDLPPIFLAAASRAAPLAHNPDVRPHDQSTLTGAQNQATITGCVHWRAGVSRVRAFTCRREFSRCA